MRVGKSKTCFNTILRLFKTIEVNFSLIFLEHQYLLEQFKA